MEDPVLPLGLNCLLISSSNSSHFGFVGSDTFISDIFLLGSGLCWDSKVGLEIWEKFSSSQYGEILFEKSGIVCRFCMLGLGEYFPLEIAPKLLACSVYSWTDSSSETTEILSAASKFQPID